MMPKKKIICITMFLFLLSISVFAEEKNEEGFPFDFSGQIYMNYNISPEYDSTTNKAQDDYEGTFAIERAYLTLKKKFYDYFSIRLTSDITKTERKDNKVYDSSGSEIGTVNDQSGQKYEFFIKYLYIQMNKSYGVINIIAKAGMIDTPFIGLINSLGDSRWINSEFINASKKILPSGSSIDNSADTGVSVEVSYSNFASIYLGYANGEGFKSVDEGTNDGKAYYGRLTITPIKSLYVFGFVKKNENNDNDDSTTVTMTGNDYSGFYGMGAAWKDDMIKVGFDFIKPYYYETDQATLDKTKVKNIEGKARDEFLIDSWIHVSLDKFISMPFLAYCRYAIGKDNNLDDSTSVKQVQYFGLGLGYEFNKYARLIAYYEEYRKEAKTSSGSSYDPERTYYLKSEVKF